MPRNILRCPKNPLSYCIAVLFAWKTLRLTPHNCRGSVHPNCPCASQNPSKCFSIFRKSSAAFCSGKFLPSCIIVNPICLLVFVGTPWFCPFEPNDSMCAYARDHQVMILNCLFDSDVIPDMSWFPAIQTCIGCPPSLINLPVLDQSICFCFLDSGTIIPFVFYTRVI